MFVCFVITLFFCFVLQCNHLLMLQPVFHFHTEHYKYGDESVMDSDLFLDHSEYQCDKVTNINCLTAKILVWFYVWLLLAHFLFGFLFLLFFFCFLCCIFFCVIVCYCVYLYESLFVCECGYLKLLLCFSVYLCLPVSLFVSACLCVLVYLPEIILTNTVTFIIN